MNTGMETLAATRKFLARNRNAVGLEIESTEGSYIIAGGRRFIDFTSGWCVGNIGWGQQGIRRALRAFAGPDYVAPAFDYAPWGELAELLCENAPGTLRKVFRCTGGSEAVDLALQAASIATLRRKFLSIEDSYHGNTVAAVSVGASSSRAGLPVALPGCIKIRKPLDGKRLRQVETALKKKEVAAVIIEPVPLNLGVELPEKSFITGLQDLCRKYGTLLIADEVATGFGRTGKFFACEYYDLQPDILCLAKALSGGYGGIGAVLTTNEVYRNVKENFNPYSTYGWHPLSVQASLSVLRYMLTNKETLLENVQQRSQQIRTALSGMGFRKGGRISMIGLAIAVDVEDEKYAAKVKEKCQEEGLLVTSNGTRVVMFPPITVDEDVTDEAMRMLETCL